MTTMSLNKMGIKVRMPREIKFKVNSTHKRPAGTLEERKHRVSESEWNDFNEVIEFCDSRRRCPSDCLTFLHVLDLAILNDWLRGFNKPFVYVDIPCMRDKLTYEFDDDGWKKFTTRLDVLNQAKKAASEK